MLSKLYIFYFISQYAIVQMKKGRKTNVVIKNSCRNRINAINFFFSVETGNT